MEPFIHNQTVFTDEGAFEIANAPQNICQAGEECLHPPGEHVHQMLMMSYCLIELHPSCAESFDEEGRGWGITSHSEECWCVPPEVLVLHKENYNKFCATLDAPEHRTRGWAT